MTGWIYVDTSVVLAHLRSERARPGRRFWASSLLISSVLAEWETWTRLHALGEVAHLGSDASSTLARLTLVGLTPEIGSRCRAAFPVPVRTLDALHLATAERLRIAGHEVTVATYDERFRVAAIAMGFPLHPLDDPGVGL